jgi:hypothetical protein
MICFDIKYSIQIEILLDNEEKQREKDQIVG